MQQHCQLVQKTPSVCLDEEEGTEVLNVTTGNTTAGERQIEMPTDQKLVDVVKLQVGCLFQVHTRTRQIPILSDDEIVAHLPLVIEAQRKAAIHQNMKKKQKHTTGFLIH